MLGSPEKQRERLNADKRRYSVLVEQLVRKEECARALGQWGMAADARRERVIWEAALGVRNNDLARLEAKA